MTWSRRLRRSVLAGALAFAAAGGAAAAGNAPTREALIVRWAAANHRSAQAWEHGPRAFATPPPSLRALATRELATAGRYRLAPGRGPAAKPDVAWWMRAWNWLRDRWTQLWSAAFGRARLGRNGAMAIGDLLIAAAGLLILFVAYRLLAGFVFERRSRTGSFEAIDSPADAPALYAAANDRARRGEYGAASRLLFAATISALALRGVVRNDRSATVGDFRGALRQRDAGLLALFDAVSSAFVTSAYAELPVDASAWERARLAYLSLAAGTAS